MESVLVFSQSSHHICNVFSVVRSFIHTKECITDKLGLKSLYLSISNLVSLLILLM